MEAYIICTQPFCKAPFRVREDEMVPDASGELVEPKYCPKCRSQQDQVSWEDKHYEGERWDGTPHQFTYKIKKFY